MRHNTGIPVRWAVYALISVLSASPHAQDVTDGSRRMLEEIVVTAQKRAENLQDIPMSVSAFSRERLDLMGVTHLGDIQFSIPNLTVREFANSKSALRLYIRGVGSGDTQLTVDPAVGVYVDGIYMSRSIGLAKDLADIERIEVLRGPQGTLYGRNSTGGAINLITARPTGEFDVTQRFSLGSRGLWRSYTTMNLPEVTQFAAKLSYVRGEGAYTVKNRGPGVDFGARDEEAWRVDVHWNPLDRLSVDYAYDRTEIESGPPYYQTLMPPASGYAGAPFSRSRWNSVTAGERVRASELTIEGHSLIVTLQLGNAHELKYLYGWRQLDDATYQDYGANSVTTRLFANDPLDVDHEQRSHELQLVGSHRNLDYVAGLYHFEEDGREMTTDYIGAYVDALSTWIAIPLQTRLTAVENKASAVYGQLSWRPRAMEGRLALTVGGRYSEDRREASTTRSNAIDGFNYTARAGKNFYNFSGSAILAYDISEQTNAYLRWSQGYRTGGFNGRSTRAEALVRPVDEERVTAWELGVKARIGNWLRLDAATFLSDYDDIQLSFATPGDPAAVTLFNAGKATISGLELDATALLTERLELNLGYGYLHSDIKKVINPSTGIDESREYALPAAPRHSLTLDARYDFHPFSWGRLVAFAGYSWRDEFRPSSQLGGPLSNTPDVRATNRIEAYGLWNARLMLTDIHVGNTQLELALWGKNLADKQYLQDLILAFPWSQQVGAFGDRRTIGVDAVVRF